MYVRRIKFAASLLALVLLSTFAGAQTYPTVPQNTLLGRTAFGSGPAQAIPFSSIPGLLCNVFTTTTKGCVPAPTTATGRYLGDDAAWHAVPSQQVVAGTGITLDGTCVGNALNCTVNATAATISVTPPLEMSGTNITVTSANAWTSYTPTPTASGSPGFVATSSGGYSVHGKKITFAITISISNPGSTPTGIAVTVALPTGTTKRASMAICGETAISGAAGVARIASGATLMTVLSYAASTLISSGAVITCSGTYEIT